MNQENQINFIREKCIEANPDIRSRDDVIGQLTVAIRAHKEMPRFGDMTPNEQEQVTAYDSVLRWFEKGYFPAVKTQPSIRLADVLLAIKTLVGNNEFHRDHEHWKEVLPQILEKWNLRADDLQVQSEETINFLYDLLQ